MAWNPFAIFSKTTTPAMTPAVTPSAEVRFAFKLFSAICDQSPNQNVFISPASIRFALTMTLGGAAAETRDEMAAALELQEMSDEDIRNGAKIVKALLERNEAAVELSIANSLWSKSGIHFRDEFTAQAREFFSAAAKELDFADPQAAVEINRWVSEKTRGKIDSIVTHSALKRAILVLINALYFKAKWAEGYEFETSSTRNGAFTLSSGATKTLPLMTHYESYWYAENKTFQIAKIPYDQRLHFYVMLPAKFAPIGDFVRNLNAEVWENAISQMAPTSGQLTLPKFRVESNMELKEALEALGMGRAFTELAQFQPMTAAPAMIGCVKHKTFVDVNESGTEAAAVTAVLMAPGCGAPKTPFTMVVDRPFVCAIRDDHTKTILFMGAIYEP
jgi:serine protease inhibitor